MIEVSENLFVGNERDCFYDNRDDWVVVHACKHPCHQTAIGYSGNLNSHHPNYLIFSRDNHLYLNLVDMDKPFGHVYTEPIISAALNFIASNIESKKVLIHCNRGESRSPALALLFLAKRRSSISNESYETAKREFSEVYPNCRFGSGIDSYLARHWSDLT
jgi:predicted protein tyrosine phosphatase